jgi:phage shock protein PspC (stress-responsive transcriptional regulator)
MLISVSGIQGHQANVEDTLKDFWATRPRRPRRGRKLAGVAAGIGNRYDIDPIVVRVAFVVATFFGGAGILFYILGWLLLPEQNDEAAPFESMATRKRSSTSSAFTVLLCLALIPAIWHVGYHELSGIMSLLIVAGGLFLLHKTRGHIGRPRTPEPPAWDPLGADPFAGSAPQPSKDPTAQNQNLATPVMPQSSSAATTAPLPVEEPARPPAWDPLGAAPFAWDLPEPTPAAPEPPQPRRRSRAGLITVGAALVVGGTLAMVAPYVGGWMSPQHIVGLVLGVIGLGMVAGSFVRGGRGLIGLAVPLSVIGLGLTVISPHGWHGVGDLTARPTTIAEVQDSYQRSAGVIDLDLTALPASGNVDTHVSVDAGDIIIVVPQNADVDLWCGADVGDVECLGRSATGPGSELSIMDHGPDGRGGLQVELHVEVGAGHAEVRRG